MDIIKDTTTMNTNTDNTKYNYEPYTSGIELAAITGMEAVAITFKKHPKTGEVAASNASINIPLFDLSKAKKDITDKLIGYALTKLSEDRNNMLRAEHIKGTAGFNDKQLNIEAILSWVSTEKQGKSRVKGADLSAWFEEEVEESLRTKLVKSVRGKRKGDLSSEQLRSIEITIVSVHKLFAGLASPITLSESKIGQLEKVLVIAVVAEKGIGGWVWKRLASMKTKLEAMKGLDVIDIMEL